MITNMKRYSVAVACLLLVGSTFMVEAATIYKKIDADGNVVFTDVPPRAEETAETIDLDSPNSFAPEPATEPLQGEPESADADSAAHDYTAAQITSPAHDSSIRENAGSVTVTAQVEPGLASGHAVQLLMDGTPVAGPSQSATFPLANVDRGTHQLYAQVVDEDGSVIFTGGVSVFHMLRYSQRTQPAKP